MKFDGGPLTTRVEKEANYAPRPWAQRLGRLLGNWLSTAVAVWSGYAYAKHGIARAAEIYGGFLVVVFALYGLFKYPWGRPEDV